MRYVEVTIEQALAMNKGDRSSKVLVAVNNLENDEVVAFVKKTRNECDKIIKEAEKSTLSDAIEIGTIWLQRELK